MKLITGMFYLTGMLVAATGPGSGTGSTSTPQVSLHVPNEIAPPGGVAQMKFMVTEPTPISSGGPSLAFDAGVFDAALGIELFCATGDLNGVATVNGSRITLNYITTAGAQGTDYPIMTIALHVRPDAVPGSQTVFQLDPSSRWTLGSLGTATLKPSAPATVTVGGSMSITNVVPGGGILPAGTVVSIRGIGFQPNTQVQLNAIKFSSINSVSSQEIQFTLAQTTNMTGQKIQVVNPDGSQDTYFSYLRGAPLASSSYPLLAGVVPVFSSVTHSWAMFTPPAADYTGIAVQNPGMAATDVTVSLYSPANVLMGTSTVAVPAGYRLMEETSEWAQGATATPGGYIVVASTTPVQVFGFAGNTASATITPFVAVLAQP